MFGQRRQPRFRDCWRKNLAEKTRRSRVIGVLGSLLKNVYHLRAFKASSSISKFHTVA